MGTTDSTRAPNKKDGKSANGKSAKKAKQDERRRAAEDQLPYNVLVAIHAVLGTAFFGAGRAAASNGWFFSTAEGKMGILPRMIFFFLAQGVAARLFAMMGLQAARFLCGDDLSREHEQEVNNPRVPWPRVELLKPELKQFVSKKGQPFFLNHVTGKQRLKDALMRIGMNLGSILTVWFTCVYMDNRSLSSVGLLLDRAFFIDAAVGTVVGFGLVAFTFAIEWSAGWLHFLQFFEVFDKSENFATCILWDVIFHLNVAMNEELPVRGWMLLNLAEASHVHLGLAPSTAFLFAMLAQSTYFMIMHLPSPGGSRIQSIANIFLGGLAGGFNAYLTGGRLGLVMGWHFGWNISMGNFFGMSTSGIPISATFISVAPHPKKEALHGGVFGPEGGAVSPFAYILGMIVCALIYGMP